MTSHRAPAALRPSGDRVETGGTILLVQEDEAARGLIRLQLQRAGYRVLEAHDAQAAEALAGVERVDLLLSDAVLPGPSGLDLARRLRAIRPDLPVILMRDALDPGVTGPVPEANVRVLRKPFRGEELRGQVAEALLTPPAT